MSTSSRILAVALAAAFALAARPCLAQETQEHAEEHAAEEHGEQEEHVGADSHGDAADSHGEHGSNINPLSIDPDLAICTAIVFFVLLAFLGKFAWGPIVAGLDKRERSIAEQIEQAARNAEQAAEQLREYEAQLASAAEEARTVVSAARQEAEAAKERIIAEAQEAAQRERHRAVEDITVAKNSAMQEMTERSVDLAVIMAGQMLKRQIQSEDHAQLIRDALDQLPSQN